MVSESSNHLRISVIFFAILTTVGAIRATAWQTAPKVTFNHLEGQFTTQPSLQLRDGEVFQIEIADTYPAAFEYVVAGIPAKTEEETEEGAVSPARKDLESKSFWIMHDKKYAGYIVTIKRSGGSTDGFAIADGGNLQPLEFSIKVETMEWQYGVAGAFTASDLTDPKYSLFTNESGKKIVIRDKGAEDSSRLGLGAFLHLYHTRLPQVALTFGMGINEANRTTYFVGPSWRFGNQGSLTAGYALGSIDRLPNGVREGSEAKDDNVLNTLPTRTVGRIFVALSYSFLDVGLDRFKKPFAGSNTSTATVTTNDTSSNSNTRGGNRNGNGNTDSGGTVENDNGGTSGHVDNLDHR